MTAICDAIEKLEKQIVKLRNRWRDTHRDVKGSRAKKESATEASAPATEAPVAPKPNGAAMALKPKVFRVIPDGDAKPMTLEEAVLEMRGNHDYMVYRDLDRKSLSVLLRRTDGHLDLIEA
jgi:hypothetical protein